MGFRSHDHRYIFLESDDPAEPRNLRKIAPALKEYLDISTTLGPNTSLVIIGDRVQMGLNVHLYTAGHETSVLSRIKFVEFGHPIRIEDDCWIGGNVVVLPGVTIGKGCTRIWSCLVVQSRRSGGGC